MKIAKSKCNLSPVESHLLFWEPLLLNDLGEQLSSLDVVHQEVNANIVLEDVVHLDDEWMSGALKDVLL